MTVQRIFIPLGFILSVPLFLLFTVTPGWAGVNCGETIGPNQVAVLSNDLTCDNSNTSGDTALILVGPKAVLKMAGHSVTCGAGVPTGIRLEGSGAELTGGPLKHGTVTGCARGIIVEGEGHHLVTKVTARANPLGGFLIKSDDNKLHHNQSLNNTAGSGFRFDGTNRNTFKGNLAKGNLIGFKGADTNDNILTANRAVDNEAQGIDLQGDGNYLGGNLAKNTLVQYGFILEGNGTTVRWNQAIGNGWSGFYFFNGTEFTVRGNTAKKNGFAGIQLADTAQDSTLIGNVALDNDVAESGFTDLFDGNADCDNNTWKWNWFMTANQTCIR